VARSWGLTLPALVVVVVVVVEQEGMHPTARGKADERLVAALG